jgi:tripartite-type tricarboxylate transporter receptor subunit TctC
MHWKCGTFISPLRVTARLCLGAVMLAGAHIAPAQNYPVKTVRIVTLQPGGAPDIVARLVAEGIAPALGQPVIVDNRGIIAGELVAKASPDGYTLLAYSSPLWLAPFMQSRVSYDPVRDFAPITLTHMAPNLLVVHPLLPAKSVRELIALARARPGELNYGSGATGASSHLSAELFKAMAGVNIVRVPYKGTPPALNDLIAGQVQVMFPNVASAIPHVKSGRLRALAITSAQPSALVPGMPTVAAAGLPGYESVSPVGLFAPAKTPVAIIARLNQEMVRTLNRAEAKERFFNIGLETVGSSPEQFAAAIATDMKRWGKVIRDAGIRDE